MKCMSEVNLIKNVAIIVDFLLSIIASAIKVSMPDISNMLFGASAVILVIAVICVIIEFINLKLKK